MAPEILQKQNYTTASDIYSFGMVMWELMTGRMPFWDQDYDISLIIKICNDFRPSIVANAPEGYIELMQKCWDSDPNKRPTASDISNIFEDKIIPNYNNKIKIIKSLDIGPIITNNPNNSKPLNEMVKLLRQTKGLRNLPIDLELGKFFLILLINILRLFIIFIIMYAICFLKEFSSKIIINNDEDDCNNRTTNESLGNYYIILLFNL